MRRSPLAVSKVNEDESRTARDLGDRSTVS